MKYLNGLSLTLTFTIFLVACSANDAWDSSQLNNTQCTKEKTCFEGYSCVVNSCIADYSLTYKSTCLDSKQCKAGLVCPPRAFNCRVECKNYYNSDSACSESTEYCAPIYDSDGTKFMGTGACVEGEDECKKGSSCKNNSECVYFKTGVGKCFKKCDYNISNSGEYSDNLETQGKTCHPVGSTKNQALVEWQSGNRMDGEQCDPYSNPCAKGLVCIIGTGSDKVCHKLCTMNNGTPLGCAAGEQCIEAPKYYFCSVPSSDGSSE